MLKYIGPSNTMFSHGIEYEETPEGVGMYSVWMDDGVGYAFVDSDILETNHPNHKDYPWRYV